MAIRRGSRARRDDAVAPSAAMRVRAARRGAGVVTTRRQSPEPKWPSYEPP
jgi:hypothetical protein